MLLYVDSKDSDQTEQMPRLIGVFAGCTSYVNMSNTSFVDRERYV